MASSIPHDQDAGNRTDQETTWRETGLHRSDRVVDSQLSLIERAPLASH